MTMAAKIRLNLQVSEQLNADLEEMADSTGSNRTEVIRQALALMKIAHQARREGRHLGLVSDPSKLDTELVGIL
jgi:metal-responsive CopG/Arc/MetJ family transcriptional regulator